MELGGGQACPSLVLGFPTALPLPSASLSPLLQVSEASLDQCHQVRGAVPTPCMGHLALDWDSGLIRCRRSRFIHCVSIPPFVIALMNATMASSPFRKLVALQGCALGCYKS